MTGALMPVPTGNKVAFGERAALMAKVLEESGAARVMDAWGVDVPDGKVTEFVAHCRIDTPVEADYHRHGGIMQYVIRSLLGA